MALVVALHHGVMMEVDVWKRKSTGVARSTYAWSAEAHAKLHHPRDPHFTCDTGVSHVQCQSGPVSDEHRHISSSLPRAQMSWQAVSDT